MPAMTMIQALNSALDVMMTRDPDVLVFGEDVGYFGGVFRVTDGLQAKHGLKRCFDTPITEGGILAAASAQGEMVAEIIAGHRRTFDPVAIPAVCFTTPEVVSVGAWPAPGPEVITAVFPLAANGRALSQEAGDDGGFVRVAARADDHRILAFAAVGRHVSELSGEMTALLEMGAVLEDAAGVIHAHPTQSETLGEAALRALGHAIHI